VKFMGQLKPGLAKWLAAHKKGGAVASKKVAAKPAKGYSQPVGVQPQSAKNPSAMPMPSGTGGATTYRKKAAKK
jgi:hypothetical protein